VAHPSSTMSIKIYETWHASKLDVQQLYGAMLLMYQVLCHEAIAGKDCTDIDLPRICCSVQQAGKERWHESVQSILHPQLLSWLTVMPAMSNTRASHCHIVKCRFKMNLISSAMTKICMQLCKSVLWNAVWKQAPSAMVDPVIWEVESTQVLMTI